MDCSFFFVLQKLLSMMSLCRLDSEKIISWDIFLVKKKEHRGCGWIENGPWLNFDSNHKHVLTTDISSFHPLLHRKISQAKALRADSPLLI